MKDVKLSCQSMAKFPCVLKYACVGDGVFAQYRTLQLINYSGIESLNWKKVERRLPGFNKTQRSI